MGGMGGMFGGGGGGGPQPKGEIQKLWNLLGIKSPGESSMMGLYAPDLAWQKYNPYQKLQIAGIPDTWVFCRPESPGGQDSINEESPITSGLTEIFFPAPGTIQASKDSELKFTKLVSTGEKAGTIPFEKFMDQQNQENPVLMQAAEGRFKGSQVIAARIQGRLPADKNMSDADAPAAKPSTENPAAEQAKDKSSKDAKPSDKKDGEKKKEREIDVVYVCDIDLMISTFLRIRARPGEDEEISWKFENVTFLLNIIDVLGGQMDYIGIRKRKPYHGTLKMVEARTQGAQEDVFKKRVEFQEEFDSELKKAESDNKKEVEKFEKKLKDMEEKQRQEGQAGIRLSDLKKAAGDLAEQQEKLNRQLTVKKEKFQRQRDEKIERIQKNVDREIMGIKNWYKFWAVIVPPIPPLLVGLVVFVRRRLREREGVAKSRLR